MKGNRWHSRISRPYVLQEIVPRLEKGAIEILDGHRVNFGSARLQTYLKGTACVTCGLLGVFFVVEQDFGGGVHLNLYGINKQGREIQMTSDHIRPKAKGGAIKDLINRQPMCEPCNFRKGTTWEPKP